MSLDILKHYPVMLDEVTSHLENHKKIVDCTFGGGGYSREILKKFPQALVAGIDRDENTRSFADDLGLNDHQSSLELDDMIENDQEASPQLFSGDEDITKGNEIASEVNTEIDTDLSELNFDDKDDLEIPAFLRRQTN